MATRFTPPQIGQGIAALALASGSPAEAKKLLDFEVSTETLRKWRDETHHQQYEDSLRKIQLEIEADTVLKLRKIANRALEIEADLLEKCAKAAPREIPQALRAVADTKTKSIDKLLALTGRAPEQQDGSYDLRALLEGMADKGLLTLNVDLKADQKEPHAPAEHLRP